MKRAVTPRRNQRLSAHKFDWRLLSGTAFGLLVGLSLILGTIVSVRAADDGIETAALAPGLFRQYGEVALPQPLSDADAARYRRIFGFQNKQHWRDADREITRLGDKLLLGHVLAQRYLSPKGYRAKFSELSGWLTQYGDQSEAPEIYRLALARMPKGAKRPRHPEDTVYNASTADSDAAGESPDGANALPPAERRRGAELAREIRRKIGDGAYGAAEHVLASKEALRLLSAAEADQLRAEIADGYYFLNKDQEALAVVDASPARTKRVNAAAEWAGGLAAWRLKHYDQAAGHFERLATADTIDPWIRSAGAYWAARSHLRNREPERVDHLLEFAGNYPYTFYGILARRLSGRLLDYNWELPTLGREDIAQITGLSVGKRVFALLQAGADARAEQELRRVNPAQPGLAHALLAVSQRVDMPALAMQLAEQFVDANGRRYDGALYPVPSWEPQGGYSIDRALVLALIRQESKFSARAISPAGARGLMQLMPGTARFVADGTGYGGRHHQLFEPVLNITLGQNYLAHLMNSDGIGDNLFMIVAAYNGGPGNLARWQRHINHGNDPLLFLESIPSRETRQFVEHVLANYWIYRDELGQPAPALDAIAGGRWPTYKAIEGMFVPAVAQYGGN